MQIRNTCALVLVGLGASACGSQAHAASKSPVRALTFNVALATDYEDYVSERKPEIQAALVAKAKEADLLCVQEYWEQSDWKDLVAATAAELPYALRRPAEPGPVGCTKTELDPLMACLSKNCPGASGQALVSCVQSSCSTEVSSLSNACIGCVTKDLSVPVKQIYATCTSGGSQGNPNDTPALFNGDFDVGLLSRFPFVEQDSKRFDAYMVRVAVLYAKVHTDLGDLNVFCTHLNSDIGGFSYGGAHGTWEQENTYEATRLAAYVNEKTKNGAPAIILGDFNTSPSGVKGIQAVWPESFKVLTDAGFTDPFIAQSDVDCSLCPGNTFRDPTSGAELVDHVLLRDFSGKATVERIFTDPITIQSQGKSVTTNLSDHYGLEATLE